ncbi:MAG: hypothetical protein AAF721_02575 [Myxococcota bacterium]
MLVRSFPGVVLVTVSMGGCVYGGGYYDEGGFDDFPGEASADWADTFMDDSLPPVSDAGDPDDEDSGPPADEESDGRDVVCGDNILIDGGFEAGTPSAAWAEESPLFGTPICDDSCSPDPGATPYEGDWFAWFGGAQRPDDASLTQSFSISAEAAVLEFRFAINDASGSGDDVFAVLVDGNTVFMRTDADMEGFEDYVLVPLTLDQWADGQIHELRFESEVFGGGLTNFFVDNVQLYGCGDIDDEGTSSSGEVVDETGSDTTGDESTSSTGGSSTGGSSTGGSSTGGSSTGGSSTGDGSSSSSGSTTSGSTTSTTTGS